MTENKSCRLLIVEDNEVDLFLLRNALEQANFLHTAEVVSTGQEALARIHQSQLNAEFVIDGILMDLNLVTHSGVELLDHIRAVPALAKTSVLILTSSSSPRDRQQAEARGISAYLSKPLELDAWLALGMQIKDHFSFCESSDE